MRGRFLGRSDPPLTLVGRERAAAKLGRLEVRAIFVSPLQRARQTADFIRCATEPVVLPELAEIDFGEWEGLTWQDIEHGWPAMAGRKVEDWFGIEAPGGESWTDFSARVDCALARVRSGPFPAAIVAHMVVNAALAARLLGADPRHFRQQYGEILACEL